MCVIDGFNCRLPDLICQLQLFALFTSWIRQLSVCPKSRISDCFVNHPSSYIFISSLFNIKLTKSILKLMCKYYVKMEKL